MLVPGMKYGVSVPSIFVQAEHRGMVHIAPLPGGSTCNLGRNKSIKTRACNIRYNMSKIVATRTLELYIWKRRFILPSYVQLRKQRATMLQLEQHDILGRRRSEMLIENDCLMFECVLRARYHTRKLDHQCHLTANVHCKHRSNLGSVEMSSDGLPMRKSSFAAVKRNASRSPCPHISREETTSKSLPETICHEHPVSDATMRLRGTRCVWSIVSKLWWT